MRYALTFLAAASFLVPAASLAHHRPGHQGGSRGLTIDAKPNPVVFGRATVISGRLLGADPGGKNVTLQSDPFPFADSGFANLANATTNAQGAYSFSQSPAASTRYRTRMGNDTSPVVTVPVRIRTSLRVSDQRPARGARVRFFGRACPQHDGQLLRLQRRGRDGRWRTVARTRLRDQRGSGCSRYSRRIRVFRDGRFRAVASSGDGDHARGISGQRRLSVH